MSFRIYFRGLICHVQVSTSPSITRAVLVDAEKHEPVLVVKKSDWLNRDSNPPPRLPAPPDEIWYDLRNQRMSLFAEGINRVRTQRVRGFDQHVPSLTNVMVDNDASKKKVKTEVHERKLLADKTFAYFDYEDGSIEPVDCYTAAVLWDDAKPGDPECVVTTLLYTADFAGEISLITDDGFVMVAAGSSIRVSNRRGIGGHFDQYAKITDAGKVRKPMRKEGRICMDCVAHDEAEAGRRSSAKEVTTAAPTVECTQTGFP